MVHVRFCPVLVPGEPPKRPHSWLFINLNVKLFDGNVLQDESQQVGFKARAYCNIAAYYHK